LNELSKQPPQYLDEVRNYLDEVRKYLDEVRKYLDAQQQRSIVVRQIACYLGLQLWTFKPSPSLAAKTVGENTRKGYPDEVNQLFLERYFLRSPNPAKRPRVAKTQGPFALRALELRERDPNRKWHSITDEVFDCEHAHDDAHPCTERLKQSVLRLRRFLRTLRQSSGKVSTGK
jgi:hypothetical protein